MTDPTPLDLAHAAMQADEEDTAARMRFYERLAESELFLLLAEEAEGDAITPSLFPLEGDDYALVFDREERLAGFAEKTVPCAAMSGRAVVEMLNGQGIGLGVNLGVAPSAILLPAPAVDWMAATLAQGAAETRERPVEFLPPTGANPALLQALSRKLALAAGLADSAWLVQARYASGTAGLLLAVIGARPGAEAALRQAMAETLVFSGAGQDQVDLVFLDPGDAARAALERVGLRFDLPAPEAATGPAAPGMDPENPPRLR